LSELDLREALPVEGPAKLEPSGLALLNGTLLTVSDKHPNVVFELVRVNGVARCRTYREFEAPPGTPAGFNLDLEGLATGPSDGLFLLSEALDRVMTLDESGAAHWVTPALESAGRQVGLFATEGGDLEGLVWLGDGDFLMAAERQPRGLLRVRTRATPPAVDAWQMESSPLVPPKGRSPDFAGLCQWRGRIFALNRNLQAVTELVPDGNRFGLGDSWSYAGTENDAAYLYSDMTYGHAEGLVISDDEILIILDNNGDARANNPADRRPLLFVFENSLDR
jgi:hypothetical protein